MKKSHLYILLISLAALLLIGGIVAFAVLPPKETSSGLVFELSADGKSYVVADMENRFARAVVVPAEHEGKPVTIIGAYAFQNCTRIESIRLPDTIEMIHSGAFKDCKRLRAITLPEGLEFAGSARHAVTQEADGSLTFTGRDVTCDIVTLFAVP